MPVFSILAVKVTPRTNQVQPLPPDEVIVAGPETIVAADAERAKLALAKLIPEGTDLNLIKMAIIAVPLT